MRISVPFFSLATIALSAPTLNDPLCVDHHDPLNPHKFSLASCPLIYRSPRLRYNRRQQPSNQASDKSMFQISFTCTMTDATLCEKARRSFERTGEAYTSVLNLKAPVIINATFTRFCKAIPDIDPGCSTESSSYLAGAATSTRSVLLEDDDRIQRLYPQALVKQFQLNPQPHLSTFDILAIFNSEIDWHFLDDGELQPNETKTIFDLVVVHEIMHGLGFTGNWEEPENMEVLIPIGMYAPDEIASYRQSFDFFIESAFDRYMFLPLKNHATTQYTQQLNTAVRKYLPEIGRSPERFIKDLKELPEFEPAREMMNFTTTPDAIAFLPYNGNASSDLIYLETELNPYSPGSSIYHTSYNRYVNTTEGLMAWRADWRRNNPLIRNTMLNEGRAFISPSLQRIMASIGWDTAGNFSRPPPPKLPSN
ncbi:uncharacterized protein VTP21DRAFT_5172 [Calcarisporiella thermophila]|uniref:uncharacterized protein n=1 Tax=Calcarisporiella thermophila TaxID=911321 RepID=UPI003742D52E